MDCDHKLTGFLNVPIERAPLNADMLSDEMPAIDAESHKAPDGGLEVLLIFVILEDACGVCDAVSYLDQRVVFVHRRVQAETGSCIQLGQCVDSRILVSWGLVQWAAQALLQGLHSPFDGSGEPNKGSVPNS